jgi:hypothetical protein
MQNMDYLFTPVKKIFIMSCLESVLVTKNI